MAKINSTDDLSTEQKSKLAKNVRDMFAMRGEIWTGSDESCCDWLLPQLHQLEAKAQHSTTVLYKQQQAQEFERYIKSAQSKHFS